MLSFIYLECIYRKQVILRVGIGGSYSFPPSPSIESYQLVKKYPPIIPLNMGWCWGRRQALTDASTGRLLKLLWFCANVNMFKEPNYQLIAEFLLDLDFMLLWGSAKLVFVAPIL